MYITNTTDEVRKIFEKIEEQDLNCRIKFLLYVFSCIYNHQLNNKNIANPNLSDDGDLVIFTFDSIGIEENVCSYFLEYLLIIYNGENQLKDNEKYIYDNGNIIGISYTEKENNLISMFEKLSFFEKLDVISEIIIRYDNDTFFDKKITIVSFGNQNGYDIAREIKIYKEKLN